MKKLLTSILLTLLTSLLLIGQEVKVTGTVRSSEDGSPLQGVIVTVKGTSKSVKTDKLGNFEILASPSDVLVVSYGNLSVEELKLDNSTTLDVALSTQDVDTMDLLSLSLEELLNVKVSTASKSELSIGDTPAIIEVFTADQLVNLGVDNLAEVLSMVAGVEVMETYYGYTAIQFRGILQSNYNNKANLLLNGQPL